MIIISLQGKGWRSTKIRVGNLPRQLNFPLLYELQYQIVVQIGAQRKCLGEETLLSARRRNFFHTQGEPSARRAFPILAFTCSHSTKLVEILSAFKILSISPTCFKVMVPLDRSRVNAIPRYDARFPSSVSWKSRSFNCWMNADQLCPSMRELRRRHTAPKSVLDSCLSHKINRDHDGSVPFPKREG